MGNNVVLHEYGDLGAINGFEKDGEPWFFANDVAEILSITNIRQNIANIKEDYEQVGIAGVYAIYTKVMTPAGTREELAINEQMFFELVFKSRKPCAIKFRAWIAGYR